MVKPETEPVPKFYDEDEAEECVHAEWHGCECSACQDPDVWYAALAFLVAERAPA